MLLDVWVGCIWNVEGRWAGQLGTVVLPILCVEGAPGRLQIFILLHYYLSAVAGGGGVNGQVGRHLPQD